MKTLTPPNTQVTSGQLTLLTRIIADVATSDPVQKALKGLDKEGAERLKGNPEFAESLRRFAVAQINELSVSDKFKDEEVESRYGYLSGYKPKDLQTQKAILTDAFPELKGFSPGLLTQIVEGKLKLPENAEGWFAIPNWMKNPQIFGASYVEAVKIVLEKNKEARGGKFYNYRDEQMSDQRLRQSARSEKFWSDLSEAQGNPDILIVPAQFGIRHRGRSVRRAREVFFGNEFGLGAFAVGIMLLTHRERLMHYDDLWIDCAGDEFDDPDSGDRFGRAPDFRFGDDEVGFDASWASAARDSYGSASGLVPPAEQQ